MKTVIVGGVAAGASTGARLRRLDESAEIVILERDHYVSFANCGLPYHVGGAIPERGSLLLQTPESLAKSLALDVRTGQEVLRIDPDAKEVEVRDEKRGRTYRESYDTLVLCPGAEPVRPPIPGADDPRVDVLRNIPDMDHIIAHLDAGASSAVVVGGSYIGLELTEAFRERGLQTTVVERTERLMPWLDPEMTRILDFHVGTKDVDLRLGTSAEAIRRTEGDRLVLDLSDGTALEADVVVLAAGARPNVDARPRPPAWRSAPAAASWSTRRCARRCPTSSLPGTPWRLLTSSPVSPCSRCWPARRTGRAASLPRPSSAGGASTEGRRALRSSRCST